MADKELENKEVVQEEDNTEVVISVAEQKARGGGWKPKEEATELVAEGKWVDYEEFNRRGELFDAVHKANQKVKGLEKQVEALAKWNEQIAKVEREKARQEILNEKRAAASSGDLEKLVDADEKLAALDKTPVNVPTAHVSNHPDMDAFVAKNEWYATDLDLQAFANGYGARVERDNPNMPTAQVLELVEKKVRETFPNKFQTITSTQISAPSVSPSRPGPSGPAGSRKKRITYSDLPEDAKQMYNVLVKTPRNPNGKLTAEKYLKDYAAISGLQYED